MALTHLPPDVAPDVVSAHLRAQGYAIVDDVAPSALLDEFAEQVRPFVESSDHGRDEYDGRHTRRTGMLVARCPAVRELVMHPLVVGAIRHFLSHATAVQLHLTQLITIEPGETQQKLHRDQMAFDYFPFPADYHAQCNTIWALTDFTAENGATHILPGTSEMADDEAMLVEGAQAEMRRGSVLFYDGKVLHGGGANRSTGVRAGINLTYSVGWVRQEENQFLAVSPEIARTLDDDLLRMLGYQQGAFALGYVGDQQDPLSLLRGTHAKVRVVSEIGQQHEHQRVFVEDLQTDAAR